VLTKSTLTIDWSTGSVGSASQWAPSVSLSTDTYRWDPRERVKPKKEKGRAAGLLGSKGSWAGSWPTRLGSLGWVGSGNGSQAGSVRLGTKGPAQAGRFLGSLGRKRPNRRRTFPLPLTLLFSHWQGGPAGLRWPHQLTRGAWVAVTVGSGMGATDPVRLGWVRPCMRETTGGGASGAEELASGSSGPGSAGFGSGFSGGLKGFPGVGSVLPFFSSFGVDSDGGSGEDPLRRRSSSVVQLWGDDGSAEIPSGLHGGGAQLASAVR
jgi:hypothetical protein